MLRPSPSRTEPHRRIRPAAARPQATRTEECRFRAAGGPMDSELHSCRCGAVFPATPSTSVSCPLCGVHQAW